MARLRLSLGALAVLPLPGSHPELPAQHASSLPCASQSWEVFLSRPQKGFQKPLAHMLTWKMPAPRRDEQRDGCVSGTMPLLQYVNCDRVTMVVSSFDAEPSVRDAAVHTTPPPAPSANASHGTRVTLHCTKITSRSSPALKCHPE